jgi:cysteine synthase A
MLRRTLTRSLSTVKLPRNPLPALQHDSILTTVGKTPLIKINKLSPGNVNIFVKAEAFNPMGSVKDRLALGVIEWAEQTGEIQPGQTIVEASSGNTGIGLAMVAAAKGYPFVCVMAESFSIERRKLMRFLGAKVVLTNPAHKGSGMAIKAKELADEHGWFRPRQFENEANAWVHTQTTGPELLEALGDQPLDYFFTSYGTGGTLKGCASYLREHSPQTKICVCEPDNAPLLYSNIETEYDEESGMVKEPHPVWRPHLLQGWAPGESTARNR